jgi:hypothetical protein
MFFTGHKLMPSSRERTIEAKLTQPLNDSRRLQGVHRLTGRLLVEINARNNWQRMAQFETDENPVLQSGAKLILALLQCVTKCNNPFAYWNPATKCAVF